MSWSLTIARARARNKRRWPIALGWSSQAAISICARVERVEGVREVEDRQSLVGCDGLEPRNGLGTALAVQSDLPTRGMITITSGTPAARHSAAIAPMVLSYRPQYKRPELTLEPGLVDHLSARSRRASRRGSTAARVVASRQEVVLQVDIVSRSMSQRWISISRISSVVAE